MSDVESRRLALYTGLTDRLGADLADLLMSFLPPTQVATSRDIESLDNRFERMDNRMERLEGRMEGLEGRIERLEHGMERLTSDVLTWREEMRSDFRHLSQRIDRLQQTTLAGFVAMIAALLAAGFLT